MPDEKDSGIRNDGYVPLKKGYVPGKRSSVMDGHQPKGNPGPPTGPTPNQGSSGTPPTKSSDEK